MKAEKFVRAISDRHRKAFEEVLLNNPTIRIILDNDWIYTNITDKLHDRYQVHPIFFKMIYDEKFSEKLVALSDQLRFKSIIKCLKADSSIENIDSAWNNISLFHEYKVKGLNPVFEPPIPYSSKMGDIRVDYDGYNWWGEAFTIHDSLEEKTEADLINRLRIEFNEQCPHNVGLFITLENNFKSEMFDDALRFILDKARDVKGERIEFPFIWKEEVVFTADYNELTTVTGGSWRGYSGPVKQSFDRIRTKEKLKDKLKKYQFPTGENARRFFCIFSNHIDLDDIIDAIYGAKCMTIDPKTRESRLDRNWDGLTHDRDVRSIIHNMDFIIFKSFREKKFIVNERHKAIRQSIEDIF